MSISDLRGLPSGAALRARPHKRWPVIALALIHGAAIGIMVWTETTPIAMVLFLLTWGCLNCLWLSLFARPALAGAISLALVASIVVLSSFKHDVVWMTVDFLDVMLIDFSTVTFLLTIYPGLRPICTGLALATIIVVSLLWWGDTLRVSRRLAVLGCIGCFAGLIVVSSLAPDIWWDVFAKENFVSKFSRSAVTATSELISHGFIEADAAAADVLPASEAPCVAQATLPHIILIHDESGFDIRNAPGIKVPEGYGSHFLSFDGKARRFLVETHGGASWYTEFNVLTGLSARSFGRFAYFLPRVAAGRVKRGLPLALRRCGYRTFSFYPVESEFMSAKSFQMTTGIEHFFDYRDMGTTDTEPDSFYYDAAATKLQQERGTGPMFAYVYLAANHFPFMREWQPDLLPSWRDPGNTPEVDEYLRRQTRGVLDYQAFVARLRREFPGEPFILVRYGDHQPAFPTFIMDPDLDRTTIARRMSAFDPRYYTTYYAIDTINYLPVDLAPALDTLDAPYLPLMVQQVVGLSLDPSFAEQRRIFERCAGIFYACMHGAEVRRFNRMLINAGMLERL